MNTRIVLTSLLVAAWILAVGCAGADGSPSTQGPPNIGATCGSTSDCGAGEYCVFPIGNCNAIGKCINALDAGPACAPGATKQVCGCGTGQIAGCGWPLGFASGPTTGEGC